MLQRVGGEFEEEHGEKTRCGLVHRHGRARNCDPWLGTGIEGAQRRLGKSAQVGVPAVSTVRRLRDLLDRRALAGLMCNGQALHEILERIACGGDIGSIC